MEKLCLPLVFLFVQGALADLRIAQRPAAWKYGRRAIWCVEGERGNKGPDGVSVCPNGVRRGGVPVENHGVTKGPYCICSRECLSPGIAFGYFVNGNGSQCVKSGGHYQKEKPHWKYQSRKIQHNWQQSSTFGYYGLGRFQTPGKPYGETNLGSFEITNQGQKTSNYDQFLRSNIDNEQDNRDFVHDEGHDHLPFRSWNSEIRESTGSGNMNAVKPGDSRIVPFVWNNPHAAELEVNIWIQQHSGGNPIVVPIRRPTCSGEGHSSSVIKFTIPEDFGDLGWKIPGFNGCNEDSKPMCVVQIYAHSVESRQYSSAFSIVIPGNKKNKPVSKSRRRRRSKTEEEASSIEAARKDPWMDLTHLREICLPSNDPKAIIKKAVPRWARLVSDVYNHAYQNSDFSPYSGQQHESISQNLQASAINKMVTGNRGELGSTILPRKAEGRIAQLQVLEDKIYKNYEALANSIIVKFGNEMKNMAFFDTTENGEGKVEGANVSGGNLRVVTANCFRCAEVGSLYTSRQQTNTYIPSFQLPQNLIAQARSVLPQKYSDLITSTGLVRIYVQSLLTLLPFFTVSHPLGIIYQPAMIKNTLLTMPDATKFRKFDPTKEVPAGIAKQYPNGYPDGGLYTTMKKLEALATSYGCPMSCLRDGTSNPTGLAKPVYRDVLQETRTGRQPIQGTRVTGECSGCKAFFFNGFPDNPSFQPALTSLAGSIVKEGLPKGEGGQPYADPDGSPRMGRPVLKGADGRPVEKVPGMPTGTPLQGDWSNVKNGPPTSAPTQAPTPKVPVDPPSKTRRRRRSALGGCAMLSACIKLCPEDPASFKDCVRTCQQGQGGESDSRPTRRRRGSRRRRRKVSLQELFDEVAAQHKPS